jgi:pSer/pThr/pTyr-binding forkhead associated (FHA) protein
MQDTSTHRATLLVKLHDRSSQEIDLTSEHFTIGRKPDNDLPIEDPAVSGHHARITKIHAVYFVEDLKSTNGTFVNDKRIDRHQLRDTDVVTIGRHRIIFRDGSASVAAAPAPAGEDLDRTMVLTGQASRTDIVTSPASLRVLSGNTDQQEYLLVKQVTAIGSHAQAAVKLTGWFAPSSAAMITRRLNTYYVCQARNGKRILVNGQEVTGEKELKDKDRIEVAGATLLFRAKSERKG